jgi:hypothetical protein
LNWLMDKPFSVPLNFFQLLTIMKELNFIWF